MVDAEFFDVELSLLLAPGPPVLHPVFLVSFDVDVLDAEVSGSSFCFSRSAPRQKPRLDAMATYGRSKAGLMLKMDMVQR